MALATRPTWIKEQTEAVHSMRDMFASMSLPIGTALSPAERAVVPTEGIPEGVTIKSVLIPPSGNMPKSILDDRIQPSEVPGFFYTLSSVDLSKIRPAETKVVFYTHGGGNILGHPTDVSYLSFLSTLVKKINGAIVFAPSYRCATVPENTFPANLQDMFTAYDYLIRQGYNPRNIVAAGDSAGGNLTIATLYLLSQAHYSLPARLHVFSPAADITYSHMSDFAKAQADVDIYSMDSYRESTAHYLYTKECTFPQDGPYAGSKWQASDPIVSSALIPVFPPGWPKTCIQYGTADQLMDASRTVAHTIQRSGAQVDLIEYANMTHIFWVLPFFEESAESMEKFAAFVNELQLSPPGPPTPPTPPNPPIIGN